MAGVTSRVSRETLIANQWNCVYEDRTVTEGGAPGIYTVVEPVAKALTIVALRRGLFCVISEFRYPLESYLWRFPTGATVGDESIIDAARRELREETGLEGSGWVVIGRAAPMSGLSTEVAAIVTCELFDSPTLAASSGEQIQAVSFWSSKRIVQSIRENEFFDGQSLSALRAYEAVIGNA